MQDESRKASTLVQRVKDEQPYGSAAFRELVEQYTAIVFRRAYRLVGNVWDAEEVVQDVFLRVHRSIGRFRPERPFEHWLLTVTTNSARSLLRTRFREMRKRAEYGEFLRGLQRARRAAAVGGRPSLRRALDRLDPVTRMAISLRFCEENTYREIGVLLGLGESAAKMRVRRGLEKLRAQMSEDT